MIHNKIGNKVRVNGTEVYYEFYPNPSSSYTIFFIHGFLASSFSFRYLISRLQSQYQLIAVDFPPYGKSGKSLDYTYSFQNTAATFNQLCEQLELKNIVLVGHSMGGQICLNMVHQKPELFHKVVLLASSGYLKQVRKSLIVLSYFPFAHIFVKRRLINTGGVEGNLAQVVYDRSQITQEMIDGYLAPFIESDAIFRAMAKFIRDREGDLPSTVLQTIQTPCLLIWGEFDKIVPPHVGKRLSQDLPNSRLVIFKNTGHLIPEEKPEETVQLMEQFIDS